jgi:hypothetical protein
MDLFLLPNNSPQNLRIPAVAINAQASKFKTDYPGLQPWSSLLKIPVTNNKESQVKEAS